MDLLLGPSPTGINLKKSPVKILLLKAKARLESPKNWPVPSQLEGEGNYSVRALTTLEERYIAFC
jgi:hypothetical protein